MGNETTRVVSGLVEAPNRLDIAVLDLIDDESVSRSWVQRAIRGGKVKCNGTTLTKPSYRVKVGDRLEVTLEPRLSQLVPADVKFGVLFYDEHLAVIDKPPNLVVHPAPSVDGLTLCHGLLSRFPQISTVGSPDRPGIVHRLDKDTSGLMVVALSSTAYAELVSMIAERKVKRRYVVAVEGSVSAPFEVSVPIGRDSRNPTRMAVVPYGKPALTRFLPLAHVGGITLLEAELLTGRTHQIRVHLKYSGLPVLGDQTYGSRTSIPLAPRVFLHSYYLAFEHPITSCKMEFVSCLPEDLMHSWLKLGGDIIVHSAFCSGKQGQD
ncbi:RluA family pseudouridine synthase [Coprothermobacteraceae bacterium]|nr:RluA family pseudouridine synthase [Coprothermobacteraceae bacterium]